MAGMFWSRRKANLTAEQAGRDELFVNATLRLETKRTYASARHCARRTQ